MATSTFPALHGTEKQITWASEIRERVLRDLEAYLNGENINLGEGFAMEFDIVATRDGAQAADERRAQVIRDGDYLHPYVQDRRDQILPRIRRRNQASWWIDQRGKTPAQVAQTVAVLLMSEEKKGK